MARTGIVVAQMGGPSDLGEVVPFVRAIFEDPALVPLPGGPRTRRALAGLIASVRGPSVRARYRSIGGGSPIRDITLRQSDMLREELRRRGHEVEVAVAMRYTDPDTASAVESLVSAGAERLVLLPLYPQYSFATTGSSETELRSVLASREHELPLEVVRSWHDHPSFLDATASLVGSKLAGMPIASGVRTVVLFTAHGIPEALVKRGDPYVAEVEATVAGVVERLSSAGHEVESRLGYQSRTGPVRWVGPGTEEVIRELAAEGRLAILAVAVSFVSDHIETLWEIDQLFYEIAETSGVEHFSRAPVLGVRPEVGPVLADVVEQHL